MQISFSTLACPSWSFAAVVEHARKLGFTGVELRFLEGTDRLWELSEFQGSELERWRNRLAAEGLAIPCIGTSCFFHYPVASLRQESLEMGKRMVEVADRLGATGIRVFGDRVPAGEDMQSTTAWVAEGIRCLAEFAEPAGVGVWLESHGDFAPARETMNLLRAAGSANTGVVWDPMNAYAEYDEDPGEGWRQLAGSVRHVHIKDGLRVHHSDRSKPWEPVLVGDGDFPAHELVRLLRDSSYNRFISFEWEKRWHPLIADPEIALPHFMQWIRAALAR